MSLVSRLLEAESLGMEAAQDAMMSRRDKIRSWLKHEFTREFRETLEAYRDHNEPKASDSAAQMQFQIGFREGIRAIEREIESLTKFVKEYEDV